MTPSAIQSAIEKGRCRLAFEAWISALPYERDVTRWPQDDWRAWPGQYRDNVVQLAWEAWEEAKYRYEPPV